VATNAAKRFVARHPKRRFEREGESTAEIECDSKLLRRALDNLLDNAAKYSDASQPVKLAVSEVPSAIAFEVVDKGVGMSAEELEKAFTPFWRADGSRNKKTGGVGLGLALARRIARAHGGDLTLKSAPGVGTTATLTIPLGAATNRNSAATPPT
jgi:two-component system, OmpR family, sensor kinase